jgi:hypothetical protein
MTYEELQQIEEQVWERMRKIRETKGREYAHDEDTLADFKEVAADAGISPMQCWLTYVQKHQRAIATFVREGSVKSESIYDRVLDVVVYHVLLLGLVQDLEQETLKVREDIAKAFQIPPAHVDAEDRHQGLSDPMG